MQLVRQFHRVRPWAFSNLFPIYFYSFPPLPWFARRRALAARPRARFDTVPHRVPPDPW
jgi:hypothetical protein